MGVYGDLMGFTRIDPLIHVYITNWKDPRLLNGKTHHSKWPFAIDMLNYQRVSSMIKHGCFIPRFCYLVAVG